MKTGIETFIKKRLPDQIRKLVLGKYKAAGVAPATISRLKHWHDEASTPMPRNRHKFHLALNEQRWLVEQRRPAMAGPQG